MSKKHRMNPEDRRTCEMCQQLDEKIQVCSVSGCYVNLKHHRQRCIDERQFMPKDPKYAVVSKKPAPSSEENVEAPVKIEIEVQDTVQQRPPEPKAVVDKIESKTEVTIKKTEKPSLLNRILKRR